MWPDGTEPRRRVRCVLRDERGLTLVELLWTMVLSLGLLGATMLVLITSLDQENRTSNRVSANDNVTVALERLTREIRQATYLATPTGGGSTLVLHEYVNSTSSTPDTIVWNCGNQSGGEYYCTRTDGAGAPVTEVTNLTSSNVFSQGSLPLDSSTSATAATYPPLTVTLSQAIPSSTNLTLSEVVTPRNCQYKGDGYNQSCDGS
jgi:Tfp pilus assembly protein PilW